MRMNDLEAFKARINEEMSVELNEGFGSIFGKPGEKEKIVKQRQADAEKAKKSEEQNKLAQFKRERELGQAENNYNYHKKLNDFYNGLKNKVGGFVNRVGKKVGNTAQSAVQDTKKDIHNAANQAQTQAHVQDNRERPAAQPAEKKSLGQRFGDGLKNLKTNYGKLKTADREESKLQQEKEDLTNKIDARDAKFKDMSKQDYATFVEPYKTSAEKADDKNLKNVSNKIEQNQENAKAHPVLNTVAKGQNKVEDIAGQLKDNFKSKDPKQLKLDFKAAEKAEKEQQKQADEEAKKAREVKVANDGQTKLDLGGLEGKTKTIDPEKKPLMDKVKDGLKNVTDKFKKPEAEEQQPKQPEVQNDDTNDNTNITSNTNRRKFQLGDKDVSLPKLIKYQQMDDYDSYGRDAYGFDKDGFYRNGFNRKGINKETGTQFDKDGFNIYGFDKDGINKETGTQFDKDGFDLNGFDKNGFDSKGFDKNNINKETGTEFDKDGFNINGLDKDGFNKSGYNEKGVDREGYSHDGFNKDGYDRNGFDTKGFNKDGVHKETGTQFNKDGFNKDGYSKYGFNKSNFNKDGINKFTGTKFDKDGYDSKGFNKAGFDRAGYDSNGFNKAGFNKEGISKETGTQFNKAGFDKDGFDKDGFDKDGFNIIGYNKEGFNRAGYDKHGRDNYGFNKDGFDEYGISKETGTEFNKEGFNKDGIHKETGTEYNKDGFDKYGNPDPSMQQTNTTNNQQQTNTTNNQQQTNTTNNQQTKKSLKDKVADAAYGAIKGANKNMQYAKNVINKKIPYVAQQGRDEGDAAFAANNPNIPMGNNNQQQNQQAAQQPQQQQMSPNPYLAQAQAYMASMMPYVNPMQLDMMNGMGTPNYNFGTQPNNNNDGYANIIKAVTDTIKNTIGNKYTPSSTNNNASNAEMIANIRTKLENGESPDSFSEEEKQAYEYYNQNGLIKDGKLVSDDEINSHFNSIEINNDIANKSRRTLKLSKEAKEKISKRLGEKNNTPNNTIQSEQSDIKQLEDEQQYNTPTSNTLSTSKQPTGEQPTQEVKQPTENNTQYDNNDIEKVRDIVKDGALDPANLPGKYKDIYDNVVSKENLEDVPKYTDKEVSLVKELVNNNNVDPSNLTGKYKEIYDTMLKDGNAEEIDNSKLSDGVKNVTETPEYNKAFVTRVRNLVKNGTDPNTLTGKYKEVYDNVISKETSDEKPQVNPQGVKNNNQGESNVVVDNQETATNNTVKDYLNNANEEEVNNIKTILSDMKPELIDSTVDKIRKGEELTDEEKAVKDVLDGKILSEEDLTKKVLEPITDENNSLNNKKEIVTKAKSTIESKIDALKKNNSDDNKSEIEDLEKELKRLDKSNTTGTIFKNIINGLSGSGKDKKKLSSFKGAEKTIIDTIINDNKLINNIGIKTKVQKKVEDKLNNNQQQVKSVNNGTKNGNTNGGNKSSTVTSENHPEKLKEYNPLVKTMNSFNSKHLNDNEKITGLIESNGEGLKGTDKKVWDKTVKVAEQIAEKLGKKKVDSECIRKAAYYLENGDDSEYKIKRDNTKDSLTFNQGANTFSITGNDNITKFYNAANKIQKAVKDKKIEIDDFGDISDSDVKADGEKLEDLIKDISTTIKGDKVNPEVQAQTIAKMIALGNLRIQEDMFDENGVIKEEYKNKSAIMSDWERQQANEAAYYASPEGKAEEAKYDYLFLGFGKPQGAGSVASGKYNTGYGNSRAHKIPDVAGDFGMQRTNIQRTDVEEILDMVNNGYLPEKYKENQYGNSEEDLKDNKGKLSKSYDKYIETLIKVGAVKRKYNMNEDKIELSVNPLYNFENLLGRRFYDPQSKALSFMKNSGIYTKKALDTLELEGVKPYTKEANEILRKFKKGKIYTRDALKYLRELDINPFTAEADNWLQHADFRDGSYLNNTTNNDFKIEEKFNILKEKERHGDIDIDSINKVIDLVRGGEDINNQEDILREAGYLNHNSEEAKKLSNAYNALKDSKIIIKQKEGKEIILPGIIDDLYKKGKDLGITEDNIRDIRNLVKFHGDDIGELYKYLKAKKLDKDFDTLKKNNIIKERKSGFRLSDNKIGKFKKDENGNIGYTRKVHVLFNNPEKEDGEVVTNKIVKNEDTGYDELFRLPKDVRLINFNKVVDLVKKGKDISEEKNIPEDLQDTVNKLKEANIDLSKYSDAYKDMYTGKIVFRPKMNEKLNTSTFELSQDTSTNIGSAIHKLRNKEYLERNERKALFEFKKATGLNDEAITYIPSGDYIQQNGKAKEYRIVNYDILKDMYDNPDNYKNMSEETHKLLTDIDIEKHVKGPRANIDPYNSETFEGVVNIINNTPKDSKVREYLKHMFNVRMKEGDRGKDWDNGKVAYDKKLKKEYNNLSNTLKSAKSKDKKEIKEKIELMEQKYNDIFGKDSFNSFKGKKVDNDKNNISKLIPNKEAKKSLGECLRAISLKKKVATLMS